MASPKVAKRNNPYFSHFPHLSHRSALLPARRSLSFGAAPKSIGAAPGSKRSLFGKPPATTTTKTSEVARKRLPRKRENMGYRGIPSAKRTCRRDETPDLYWERKPPLDVNPNMNMDMNDDIPMVFKQGGCSYPIKKIGSGEEHTVYEFSPPRKSIVFNIRINDTTKKVSLFSDKIILKVLNTSKVVGSKNKMDLFENASKAHKLYLKKGVPTPKVYVEPKTYVDDTKSRKGGFYIMEKMVEQVTCDGWKNAKSWKDVSPQDKKVLRFARQWLQRGYQEKKVIVADFYPRNVMLDSEGEPRIVDFGEFDSEIAPEKQLDSMKKAWSAGNPLILKMLSEPEN